MTPLQNVFVIAGGVLGAALIAWPIVIWYEVRGCEKPKYVSLRPLGSQKSLLTGKSVAEIRKYAPYLIAETVVQGENMKEAMSTGFRRIAGFIFGDNHSATSERDNKIAMTSPVRMEVGKAGQKIAMTAPVAAELGPGTTSYRISFVMPSKYTKDTLPAPNDTSVSVKTVESKTLAALTFSGNIPHESRMEKKADELRQMIEAEGLHVEGDLKLYQYHPPFAPGWMRKNEVLYEVSGV